MLRLGLVSLIVACLAINFASAESEDNQQNNKENLVIQGEETQKLLWLISQVRNEKNIADNELENMIRNNTERITELQSKQMLLRSKLDALQIENLKLQLDNEKLRRISENNSKCNCNETAINSRLDKIALEQEQLRQKLQRIATAKDCKAAMRLNGEHTNGVYHLLHPLADQSTFEAYCIHEVMLGDPWTVIMMRENGSTSFDCTWNECKSGFGKANGEYFLGMELLHLLTQSPQQLWLHFEDNLGNRIDPIYENIRIGSEQTAYALESVGNYYGTGYDQLLHHIGQKLTTKDVDNDTDADRNCAIVNGGPGWFAGCNMSNLFGSNGQTLKQIHWGYWPAENRYVKYMHMAIRSVPTK